MPQKNLYDVLRIPSSATKKDINKAYKKLAIVHHPDKDGGSKEKFQELCNAYNILSNTKQRWQYDNTCKTDTTKRQQYDNAFENYDRNLARAISLFIDAIFVLNGVYLTSLLPLHLQRSCRYIVEGIKPVFNSLETTIISITEAFNIGEQFAKGASNFLKKTFIHSVPFFVFEIVYCSTECFSSNIQNGNSVAGSIKQSACSAGINCAKSVGAGIGGVFSTGLGTTLISAAGIATAPAMGVAALGFCGTFAGGYVGAYLAEKACNKMSISV